PKSAPTISKFRLSNLMSSRRGAPQQSLNLRTAAAAGQMALLGRKCLLASCCYFQRFLTQHHCRSATLGGNERWHLAKRKLNLRRRLSLLVGGVTLLRQMLRKCDSKMPHDQGWLWISVPRCAAAPAVSGSKQQQ